MDNGFFRLKTPYDLFCKVKCDFEDYCKNPNDYSLFNLLCGLNHLREWIEKYQNNHKFDSKPQFFVSKLLNDSDYKVIKELCNNAKHFKDLKGIGQRSNCFEGFRTGFSRAGDRLGQMNNTVDGKDIRDVVFNIYKKYKKYFEEIHKD